MLYAVKWHQMSSLSLICGWNYKLVEKSEPNRRMPLVSNCQDKFCTTPISLSFLLSNINIPFLHLFCGRSARHTYGNTIKPHCFLHRTWHVVFFQTHTFLRVHMTMLITGKGKQKITNRNVGVVGGKTRWPWTAPCVRASTSVCPSVTGSR